MKKCPFCAEEIQDEAIKCRHCGEFLDPRINREMHKIKPKRDLSDLGVFVGFLLGGPFVIPIIWLNKKYSRRKKIILTAIISITTIIIILLIIKLAYMVIGQYKSAFDMLEGKY